MRARRRKAINKVVFCYERSGQAVTLMYPVIHTATGFRLCALTSYLLLDGERETGKETGETNMSQQFIVIISLTIIFITHLHFFIFPIQAQQLFFFLSSFHCLLLLQCLKGSAFTSRRKLFKVATDIRHVSHIECACSTGPEGTRNPEYEEVDLPPTSTPPIPTEPNAAYVSTTLH